MSTRATSGPVAGYVLRYDLDAVSEGHSGKAGNILTNWCFCAAPEIMASLTFPLVFPFLLPYRTVFNSSWC
jgi:hypothetical protein